MKTPKARNNSGDDWKTPDWFYSQLDKIYHFDFDPCPYQADFDGLKPKTLYYAHEIGFHVTYKDYQRWHLL